MGDWGLHETATIIGPFSVSKQLNYIVSCMYAFMWILAKMLVYDCLQKSMRLCSIMNSGHTQHMGSLRVFTKLVNTLRSLKTGHYTMNDNFFKY